MTRDPEDFPALVPPAGSSTNLLDFKDAVNDGSKDRNRRANPKDPPPGSFDWVAAKNSSTSSSTGKEGGPKRTVGWPSGRGPKGTIRDPEDFPALLPPAGSSTNLTAYTLIECFFEGPVMYWVPALMKNSNNYKVKLKFHLFWFIKNALFKLLIDSFQQKLLKLNGSKDSNGRVVMVFTEYGNPDVTNNPILNIFEDKQLSILESIQIRIQQFWPFRFSKSSEEERRIRLLIKVFVALNIWQDYISEVSIEEIAILRAVLIKFTSLLKTHFSLAVAGAWIPEVRTLS